MAISLDATLQMRQRSYNLALDGCVACVRPACTQTSRLLDPTSVHFEHLSAFFAFLLPSTHCTYQI